MIGKRKPETSEVTKLKKELEEAKKFESIIHTARKRIVNEAKANKLNGDSKLIPTLLDHSRTTIYRLRRGITLRDWKLVEEAYILLAEFTAALEAKSGLKVFEEDAERIMFQK